MSIATKTGDDGTTALLFGRRVPKTDPRIAANGACDELNAALGVARAHCGDPALADALLAIQKELVTLMGEVACAEEDHARFLEKGFHTIDAAHTARLTAQIDDLEKNHRISYKHWATPGALPSSAFLDLARTACRRAERALVELPERGFPLNAEAVRYLNRLSDLCWLWARFLETRAGVA